MSLLLLVVVAFYIKKLVAAVGRHKLLLLLSLVLLLLLLVITIIIIIQQKNGGSGRSAQVVTIIIISFTIVITIIIIIQQKNGGSGRSGQVVWRKLWSPLRAAASYLPDNTKMETRRKNCEISVVLIELCLAVKYLAAVVSDVGKKGALFPVGSKTAARNLFEAINLKLADICWKNYNIIWQNFWFKERKSEVSEKRNGTETCCIQLILLVAKMVWIISAVFCLALVGFGCFYTFWLAELVLEPVFPSPKYCSLLFWKLLL